MAPSPTPVDEILTLPRFGAGLGLHRMLDAIAPLDAVWLGQLDAIKVTGSNGKGSTCTMVAAILQALGVRVGLYTSPHLHRINERICVQGQPISDAELDRSVAWVLERRADLHRRHPQDHYGAFEALTLAALHHFARMNVDVVVSEAGIGGRYDPTRVIPGRTCGLVSIELEHTALLGSTEEAIAFDKADLCPAGGELVVGPLASDLLRRLRAYCQLRGVDLQSIDSLVERTVVATPGAATPGESCRVRLVLDDLVVDDLKIPSPGLHQVDNAAVALLLVSRWLRRHRPELAAPSSLVPAVEGALACVRLPGRMERVSDHPPVFVDIGHSLMAMHSVAQTLRSQLRGSPLLMVAGVSEDRDPALVAPVAALADHVICTRAHHRGGDEGRVAAFLAEAHPDRPRQVCPTIEHAMPKALKMAQEQGMTVFVGGGLFLAMEAVSVMRGEDPRRLRFV